MSLLQIIVQLHENFNCLENYVKERLKGYKHYIRRYYYIVTFTAVRNECKFDNLGNTPCRNGGICYDLLNGYTCSCVGNYQGTNCEEEGNVAIILWTIIKTMRALLIYSFTRGSCIP